MSDSAAMTKAALSDRETQILLLAWAQCLEEKPKIDYNKLTTLLGSKSVASATKTYQNALKKLVGSDVSSLPTAGGGEKAGTPAGKKKRAASETADADDGETPKKKQGRKPKAKGETEEAEKGEEVKDDGEGEGVKDEPVSDGEEI